MEFTEALLEYNTNRDSATTPAARRGENPTNCKLDVEGDVKNRADSLRSIGFSLLVTRFKSIAFGVWWGSLAYRDIQCDQGDVGRD